MKVLPARGHHFTRLLATPDKRRVLLSKARVRLDKAASRMLLGKVAGRLPDSSLSSLDEASHRQSVRRHVMAATRICEPCIAEYPFPDDYGRQFRRSKAFDGQQLYELTDVCVHPNSGLVWLPSGLLLEESVGSLRRLVGWGGLLYEPLSRARHLDIPGPVVACPDTGYYHWVFEVLPALLSVLQRHSDVTILIRPDSPSYITEALDFLLGQAKASIHVLRQEGAVRVRHLLMPSHEPFSGFVHPAQLSALRDFASKVQLPDDPTGSPAVYVSRRGTRRRRLKGEEEVEKELAMRGVRIIRAEGLPWREQLSIFSGVRTLIGPHGAGLANLIWAEDPAGLIEIFPNDSFNDCYARLAVSLNRGYRHVVSEPSPKASGTIPIRRVISLVERAW